MAVSFYTDTHVHKAIVDGLRMPGVDVLTAQEDEADALKDAVLLDRATNLGRVIVTYDDDFVQEARRRQSASEDFSGVVYSHQLHARIGLYVDHLEVIAKVMDPEEMHNRVLFLPL